MIHSEKRALLKGEIPCRETGDDRDGVKPSYITVEQTALLLT